MLYIYYWCHGRERFGDKYVNVPQFYFNNNFEEEWMMSDYVKNMVLDVDKSTVLYPKVIDSPVLGVIPVTDLSTGVKSLILMYNKLDIVISGERLGDNCWKWVFEMSKTRDIRVTLNHCVPCLDCKDIECVFVGMDNDAVFHGNGEEFFYKYLESKEKLFPAYYEAL